MSLLELIPLTNDVVNITKKQQYINKITDHVNELINDNDLDDEKIEMLQKLFIEYEKKANDVRHLDLMLNEYLYTSRKTHTIYSETDFPNKIKDIGDDSLIIYIKKAQVYKVYNADGLDDFCNDEGTHYRKQKHGPVYEVVRDSHPQKLMIVLRENVQKDKLAKIQDNINEFVRNLPEFSESDLSHVKIFSNNNNTEFMISSIKLKNLQAKESFIEDFMIFMKMKGETEIADRIELRHPISTIKGVRFYDLPSVKTLISQKDDNKHYDILDQLITTPTPVVIQNVQNIQNNTYIINNINGSANTINNGSIISKSSNPKKSKKTIASFCKFIYDSKPDWYLENQYVSFDIIEDAYRQYFNDTTTGKSVISKNLNGYIFSKSTRSNNTTKKKLFAYDALKNQI